ncbi:ABC-type Fe(3+)-siderophore transport system permease component [Methanonatronarchaeum thermophilum]|uniref:ABC-type Fe(3+)-siderophore transport system permease component n=1 Tax=Methanonatronarchaeum thermophilum TaxID=1927129 RepID=A0A1Y3GB47_9EURY|nr:iron ABC transporter permease [Methanonatronarchaeum thermophilum]OUJ18470.1 ABC-type Fe(3+)-siderophore transport system permease component [Methanonatronarchaeum thermophilum]
MGLEHGGYWDSEDGYAKYINRKYLFLVTSLIILGITSIASLSAGSATVGIVEAVNAVLNRFFPTTFSSSHLESTIVWHLRMPRVFMAIVAGACLAVAGVVMQNILKNPLASPYTLGVASGAGFGAALVIVTGGFLGLQTLIGQDWVLVISAFIFALAPAFLIIGITKMKGSDSATLILAGIAMMYLFSAGLSLLQYIGDESEVTAIVYWLFGSLGKADWMNTGIVTIILLIMLIPVVKWTWDFNALMLGDETASSLGVDVEKIRIYGMVVASLMTAAAVSFLGTIGFIGLVAPHITRMIYGTDHRFLVPASAIIGAIILVASDTVARTIIYPEVLPVGILTSFLGVPLFLYLILRRRKRNW